MSDLDKAVESGELKRVISRMNIAGIHPSLKLLCSAARRFLALTETGPDLEAMAKVWKPHRELSDGEMDMYDHEWQLLREMAHAALADYLTEEP